MLALKTNSFFIPMKHPKFIKIFLALSLFIGASSASAFDSFIWPQGKRAAVSLTFDDARESQLDVALPILNHHGVKATFYVLPDNVKLRLDNWKTAVVAGHEIGNHTINHSCSGNFPWVRKNALEDRTLEQISHEIDVANVAIGTMLDVTPVSFAYPCGQTFVGRGVNSKSYVPVIAERFNTGRTYPNQVANAPAFCDLSRLTGIKSDGLTWKELKILVDATLAKGTWLILVGHEVGIKDSQTMSADALTTLLEYAKTLQNDIWIAPVNEIASHIASTRPGSLQPRGEKQRWNLQLPIQLVIVGKILGTGLLSFFCGIFFTYKAPPKISKPLFFSGAAILLLISIWSIRDGYIGPKGLMPIFATLGYSLGCLSMTATNRMNKKK